MQAALYLLPLTPTLIIGPPALGREDSVEYRRSRIRTFPRTGIPNTGNAPAGLVTAPDANSTNDMPEGFQHWKIGESTSSIGSVEINSQRNRQSPKI